MRSTACLCLLLGATCIAAEPTRSWDAPFPGVVQDAANIRGFVGEYRWLSNFYPCRVVYEGLAYQSSEAAYQAAKLPPTERAVFQSLDADAAKKLAHSKKVDAVAWDARKDQVMRDVLWAKFSENSELTARLLATGDRYLEETNWWNDPYWGVYQGQGQNVLGRILMETRTRLARRATEAAKFAVCVFCGSSNLVDARYLRAASEIGARLADHGWVLVWGGDTGGLMGALASAAKAHGGRLVGVTTADFKAKGYSAPYADSLSIVERIGQRKEGMQERAAAFVVLPGGTGTLDEMADTLEKRMLGEHRKPIILFNQDGYFDGVVAFLAASERDRFTRAEIHSALTIAASVDEVMAALERSAPVAHALTGRP